MSTVKTTETVKFINCTWKHEIFVLAAGNLIIYIQSQYLPPPNPSGSARGNLSERWYRTVFHFLANSAFVLALKDTPNSDLCGRNTVRAFACWRRNATATPSSYWWSHKSEVVHCPLLWHVFVKGELVFLQKICHLGEHSSHIQMATSTIGSQLHLVPWRYIVFLVCLCSTAAPRAREAWHKPVAVKRFFQKFLNWKRRKAQRRRRSITVVVKYNKRSKVQGYTSINQLYCPHIHYRSLLARLCPHRVCTIVSIMLWATSWLGKLKESQEQCSYSPGKRRCYLSERSGKPCPQLGISLEGALLAQSFELTSLARDSAHF